MAKKERKQRQVTQGSASGEPNNPPRYILIIAAIIGCLGVIVAVYLGLWGQGIQAFDTIFTENNRIALTQTAEANATVFKLNEIAEFTNTPTYTLTPTITPTIAFTPTLTFTPTPTLSRIQIVETQIPSGFLLYDTFDSDTGRWKFIGNSTQCPRMLENGALKIECFGDRSGIVEFMMMPSDPDDGIYQGIAMAFYTLPLQDGTVEGGKFQLLLRFGSSSDKPERDYSISIAPNEIRISEAVSDGAAFWPPRPKRPIGTFEVHIIRIELKNNLVYIYLDGVEIYSVAPLANTTPVSWNFMSQDGGDFRDTVYRGIVLLWVAIKP